MMVKAINNGRSPTISRTRYPWGGECEGFAGAGNHGIIHIMVEPVIGNEGDPGARSHALAHLLFGAGENPRDPAAVAWAAEIISAGHQPSGCDPTLFPPDWRAPLADAGVPFARAGSRLPLRISESAEMPTLTSAGDLIVPPLARFRQLTSLPLKPLRRAVQNLSGIRLQVATGVHLWMWANQLVLINTTTHHRGGFVHGPSHGMRSVVALDPGQTLVLTW